MAIQKVFFNNYLLMLAVFSWLAAQVLKTLINFIVTRKFSFERLVGSGGMPSSHSALVCSLMVGAARAYGFSSPLFAVSFVLALIVMYDARGVRLETGKQAKLLNLIIDDMLEEGKEISMEKKLKELVGHTPLQVISGALLGLGVAMFVPVF